VTAATGSQRIGIGSSVLFLIAGLVLLQWVREPKA
jgi:MFS-type transporter involved in bile tolerance (Atg22 family)